MKLFYLVTLLLTYFLNNEAQAVSYRYELQNVAGSVEVKFPGSPTFVKISKLTKIPEQTIIRLSRSHFFSTPKAIIKQEGIREIFEVSGERVLRVSSSLAKMREMLRESVVKAEILPDLEGASHKVTDSSRVLTLVEGAFRSKKTKPKAVIDKSDVLLRTPILPIFPGTVEVVETDSFPVQIDVGWNVSGGQVEPHKLFVWTEDQLSYSPYSINYGGFSNIQLTRYGKYFWQIQDSSGRFVSLPRTILVRSRLELSSFDAALPSSILRVKNILPNSIVGTCLSENSGKWFEALVDHQDGLDSYEVETKPASSLKKSTPVVVSKSRKSKVIGLPLVPKRSGAFAFRILGKRQGETVAVSEFLPIKFVSVCGEKQDEKLWSLLDDQANLQGPGAVVLLP